MGSALGDPTTNRKPTTLFGKVSTTHVKVKVIGEKNPNINTEI